MNQEKINEWAAHFYDNFNFARMLLSEFEKAMQNDQNQPLAKVAYMEVIIINLAKVFSSSRNEVFRLDRIKNVVSKDIREKIDAIEKEHKSIIGKININRDKLVAHTDEKFYELGFSEEHIRDLQVKFGGSYNVLRATSKERERYRVIDLVKDITELEIIFGKLEEIFDDVMIFNN